MGTGDGDVERHGWLCDEDQLVIVVEKVICRTSDAEPVNG